MRPTLLVVLLSAAVACSSHKTSDSAPPSPGPDPGLTTDTSAGAAITVSSVQTPVAVSSVQGPVAVSGVEAPVAVSGVAAPVTVSAVTAPVAVSSVEQPIAVSSIASPVQVTGAVTIPRPENDPERVETGSFRTATTEGCRTYDNGCKALVKGPLIVTDLIAHAGGSSYYLDIYLSVCKTTDGFCTAPRWHLPLHVPSGTSGTSGSIGSGSVYATTTTVVGVQALTGLRLAVRAGETLYASTSNPGFELTWSGFRP